MNKERIKKILNLFRGKDEWASEIDQNKNILARESVKTQIKLKKFNHLLYHNTDTAFYIAKALSQK